MHLQDICIFYKRLPTYNPQKTYGHTRKISKSQYKKNCTKSTDYGNYSAYTYDSTERYPTSVLTFSTDKQKGAYHPTQKPVALLNQLIKTYTNEGDIVLDNCMGSGSTGVAAVLANRNFIGMEIEKEYYAIAHKRIYAARVELGNNVM